MHTKNVYNNVQEDLSNSQKLETAQNPFKRKMNKWYAYTMKQYSAIKRNYW